MVAEGRHRCGPPGPIASVRNNDNGADLLTRDQLDARYESQGGEPGFPTSIAGGTYATVPDQTAAEVLRVPAGIVVTDLLFYIPSLSVCKVAVAKGTTILSNFFLSGEASKEIHYDVGVVSDNDVTVTLGADLAAGNCTASVTWTGYSTPEFVDGHGYGAITLADKFQTTFSEVQIPAGDVIGSVGVSIPLLTGQGASANCEVRVRQGDTDLLIARHGDTDFEPFVINLGAGIPSDGDVWIGVRSHSGAGPGCPGPMYWTTRTDTTPLVP